MRRLSGQGFLFRMSCMIRIFVGVVEHLGINVLVGNRVWSARHLPMKWSSRSKSSRFIPLGCSTLTFVFEAADRLAHYRSEIRAAANAHIAAYRLGIGQTCERRAAALLEGNMFVFDGHWDSENGQVRCYGDLMFYAHHCDPRKYGRSSVKLHTSTPPSSRRSKPPGLVLVGHSETTVRKSMSRPFRSTATKRNSQFP